MASGMNIYQNDYRHIWGSTYGNPNLRKIAFFPIAPENIHTSENIYISQKIC